MSTAAPRSNRSRVWPVPYQMAAVLRLDNDLATLLRQLTELALDVDDLRLRLLEIAEHAASTLSGR